MVLGANTYRDFVQMLATVGSLPRGCPTATHSVYSGQTLERSRVLLEGNSQPTCGRGPNPLAASRALPVPTALCQLTSRRVLQMRYRERT